MNYASRNKTVNCMLPIADKCLRNGLLERLVRLTREVI